jgi:hypothetical protein
MNEEKERKMSECICEYIGKNSNNNNNKLAVLMKRQALVGRGCGLDFSSAQIRLQKSKDR